MKHTDILSLICKNRKTLDYLYQNRESDINITVPDELVEAKIVTKFGNSYKLNRYYLQFINFVLENLDSAITFEDYEYELKEIEKFKVYYIKNQEYSRKNILDYIFSIKEKVAKKDIDIKNQIFKLSNDVELELDLLIEELEYILDETQNLLIATKEVGEVYENLLTLDENIREIVKEELFNLEFYISNIEYYCDELQLLLLISRQKRLTNKKLFNIALAIKQEKEHLLEIQREPNKYAFSAINKISTYLNIDEYSDKIIKKVNQFLKVANKKRVAKIIKKQDPEYIEIKIVNKDKIINDLVLLGTNDIYKFIKAHSELDKYSDRRLESFKLYLYIISENHKELVFEKIFNEEGIRVVRWINQ